MKLSVIICTYNREKYIFNVLKSIAENDFPFDKYEIVLVNNNCTDNTESECKRFQEVFPQVDFRYFVEKNQGISYARNQGILASSYEIIVFIDDDETIESDFLNCVSSFFRDYSDAGISSGPVIPIFETEKPQWLSPFIERIFGSYNKGTEIKLLSPKDYPGTGHACFRKELFEKYGAFDTNLGRTGTSLLGGEDKDFFLRLMNGGEKCYYLPTARIYHHIPEKRVSSEFFKDLTFSIGKSERIRTLQKSKIEFLKRLILEGVKWVATILLSIGYLLLLSPQKACKLIQFRWYVSKGLIKN